MFSADVDAPSAGSGGRSMCPIAGALDLLGDRWTLLVLRDVLVFGKHLYREFEQGPERISTHTLSERLRRFEAARPFERRAIPRLSVARALRTSCLRALSATADIWCPAAVARRTP